MIFVDGLRIDGLCTGGSCILVLVRAFGDRHVSARSLLPISSLSRGCDISTRGEEVRGVEQGISI